VLQIPLKLLDTHRMVALDEVTQIRVSLCGWLLQAMSRGDRQGENLIWPKTAPTCNHNLHDRHQCGSQEK
jgi:hypothetical protein